MRQRNFWIYIVAFLFICGELIVTIYHHHHYSTVLHDVNTTQIYCHYAKSPISTDSIQCIVHALLLIAAIYLPLVMRRRIVYSINLDFFHIHYLIFISAFPYRAPPER